MAVKIYRVSVKEDCRWHTVFVAGRPFTKGQSVEIQEGDLGTEIRYSVFLDVEEIKQGTTSRKRKTEE